MANIKSSKKDSIKSKKRKLQNSSKRSMIRTCIKKVYLAIRSKNKKNAELEFKKMQSIIDKYALKNIIHKNKSSRHKSILSQYIKNL